MFFVEPPVMAIKEPISPVINPADRANRLPPMLVNRANGKAIAAAPRTEKVWASPAKVSESVIDATRREPAATVPATPTPLRTCVVMSVLTIWDWWASLSASELIALSLWQSRDLLAVGHPLADLKKEIDLVHFAYTPRGI